MNEEIKRQEEKEEYEEKAVFTVLIRKVAEHVVEEVEGDKHHASHDPHREAKCEESLEVTV